MAFNPKALQQMQARMQQAQRELEEASVTGQAGGGAVQVTCTGAQKIVSVEISEAAAAAGDREMLQDLVVAATNDALERSRELQAGKLSGAMGMGGLGGALGGLGGLLGR